MESGDNVVDVFKELGSLLRVSGFPVSCIGASVQDLQHLEQTFKYSLPEDIRSIYLFSDGEPELPDGEPFGIFYSYEFLSISSALKHLADNESTRAFWARQAVHERSVPQSFPAGAVEDTLYHPAWLPFAFDWGGNYFAIDFSPGPNGVVGQVINFGRDEDNHFQLAKCLGEFLVQVRDAYRGGFGHERLGRSYDLYHKLMLQHFPGK
jgi:cell wall assembly regulator SMI1